MSSGFSVSGVSSGLDWAALVDSLVAIEGNKKTLVVQKKSSVQTQVVALQALNVNLSLLATAAKKAADVKSWDAVKATSTSYAAAIPTVRDGAQPGSLTFSVEQVAVAQRSASATVADDGSFLDGTSALTIVKADGEKVTITPTGSSLADIVAAVNAHPDAGVSATLVKVSNTGGNDDGPTYRIQFTARSTGTDGAFEVWTGTADAPGARVDAVTQAAANARITLFGDTTIEQSSNTFKDIIAGLDFTIAEVSAQVTINVEPDKSAITALAKGMVDAVNSVLSDISARTRPTTGANGSVTGGVLAGETVVRSAQMDVTSALSWPINGQSPSVWGIEIQRDGTFVFDETKFAEAWAADPAGVEEALRELAGRVEQTANKYSDRYDGLITKRVSSHEQLIRDLDDQIEAWNQRLAARKETLTAKFIAMETRLAQLEGLSSWLTSQFDAMTGANNKK